MKGKKDIAILDLAILPFEQLLFLHKPAIHHRAASR